MRQVFDCGNYNDDGICRSICARWLYTIKKKGGEVTDIEELGTKEFIKMLWDAARDDEHIDKNNLLTLSSTASTTEGKLFSTVWMATELTRGGSRAILTAWDKSLSKGGGWSKDYEGHSMAVCKVGGKPQFLDPNTSCWEFDNTLEFYEFLPGYIDSGTGGPNWFDGYPELLRYQGIVYKYI